MDAVREKYDHIPVIPSKEFADEIPLIYAPFKNYISQVLPLMLHHAWYLKNVNNISANDSLMQCAWIGRLITLDKRVQNKEKQNEIPGWLAIRDNLIERISACKGEKEISRMIADCMQVITPVIEQRFKENYHFPPRMFHCWWYTIHDDNSHLAIHLVNAFQPDSPFDHLHHFLTTMLQTIEEALSIYSKIKIVSCGSWLNQLPKFQLLWPDSFKQDQKILNETGGFGPGAWGQYMTVDGGFNEAKAAILIKTGKHPFALTEARSPINEVISHLKKLITEMGNKNG